MCFSQGVFSNLELCTQKLLVFPTAPLVLIIALENSQQAVIKFPRETDSTPSFGGIKHYRESISFLLSLFVEN